MNYFVYILQSELDGTLYIGQTDNLVLRFQKHNKGLVKSTRPKNPYRLVYFEEHETRAKAMRREWELKKKWNTERKRKLIESFDKSKLKKLFEKSA
ncbi:MAG: GIY-YIG nuclease family protein [Bacteroidota bacterium]|nr:GIY-YIG nuclease family protein [Bacteroidota bacterium]